jgi:DNA polymerase elongation subunit (family B)
MQPFINKKYEELAKMMNAYDNKMVMEREVIADKGIWTAKKRYILQVHDSEGVRYETPKLKIMGIETTRSSTPQVVRDKLKECIKLILTTDEKTVIDFIEEFRDRFISLPAEDVAFPRGVNGLERYRDIKNIYSKGTPIAVKGALIYNYMIQKKNLDRKYEAIREGDKVKFLMLKVPNPTPEKVLAFTSNLPKEFELEKYIDYDTQFQKAFIDPIKTILETVGWQHERTATLEDLFA